ncbi:MULTISPECIES: cytochrome C oxidase subunit IV family protein [unclassified Mycolicibacterium]|uniref:cytochrome C oxidase subunit IV family protein n=1 Tax=unclassified Mycolicibacterium TaxID=2636767 RepID=UPI00130C12AA|nr:MULTISPECIES: cytochrome C oxidase subunit IV family protein [unclassified Mycolicibacterium]MUL83425.1 cytochrome C oxidase subunit IV family protein [Mycolicibacterium sp. CBMA 329]MUL90416.1 cytochrome C oxidase subunit IV family protein [Mycolicibacterium sp. CBMA 331]MUM00389.1 cytochrome C oxidase subunit IV family protein [Mycolicibacterium sp. CBMA 334]MUM29781.1 cytochrome C oxidase subunit IV family protein [Mycolicibacterium sp. CBMA 295]MUM41360.1 cytochrome C oxidase subunit IV
MTVTTQAGEQRRITYVWLFLSVITVVSWWVGHLGGGGAQVGASVPITVVVLALAVLKSRLIIGHFMEVRTAPAWLRIGTDVWLAVLWGAVLVIYLW